MVESAAPWASSAPTTSESEVAPPARRESINPKSRALLARSEVLTRFPL
ncbi:hypothetical protein W823_10320 [Williamsia sp. D3]|nr:hypothetical protein W823_10320 [Williamsia sp. D3]